MHFAEWRAADVVQAGFSNCGSSLLTTKHVAALLMNKVDLWLVEIIFEGQVKASF